MKLTSQRTLICAALNVSIGIVVGAACFSAWSIYARHSEGFIRSVGGAVFLFPLALLFGALVFIVPGIIHGVIVALLSSHVFRHSYLGIGLVSALLAAILFPSWLLFLNNPLQKLWPVIAPCAAISGALAAILSLRIVSRSIPPHEKPPIGRPLFPHDRSA